MITMTFMGSLCISWLLHPPEILLFKPNYFPTLFYWTLAQFIAMVISFFIELTVEDPYTRKSIYIEGVTFIFLWMLNFLITFIIIYFLAYRVIYRYYLATHIALDLKKQNRRIKDDKDINKSIGRELDSGLKNDINSIIDEIDDKYDHDNSQPFQLSQITFEEIFGRLEVFLNHNLGQISLKLYQNYYSDWVGSLINCAAIITFLILNLICSKYSILLYFATWLLSFLIDHQSK